MIIVIMIYDDDYYYYCIFVFTSHVDIVDILCMINDK